MVGGIVYSLVLSASLYIPSVVNTISGTHIGHVFFRLSALVQFGTRTKASSFGVKRSKFKVTVGPASACWKMDFLANGYYVNAMSCKLLD